MNINRQTIILRRDQFHTKFEQRFGYMDEFDEVLFELDVPREQWPDIDQVALEVESGIYELTE